MHTFTPRNRTCQQSIIMREFSIERDCTHWRQYTHAIIANTGTLILGNKCAKARNHHTIMIPSQIFDMPYHCIHMCKDTVLF